jgi:hypothetical protein
MAGTFHATMANQRGFIMQRKRHLCASVPIMACHPGVFVEPYQVNGTNQNEKKNTNKTKTKKPTRCEACRSIVKDIEFVVERLDSKQAVSKTVLAATLDGLCGDISMRHETSVSLLEEACEDLYDEYQQGIIGTVSMHERLSRTGFTPDDSLVDKICGEMASYCEKEETKGKGEL